MGATNRLTLGDAAPDFTLPATDGHSVHLYDVLELAPVVLFFYLRAFTPVCTAEVCSFRNKLPEFESLAAVVYGISSDSLVNAERFAKYNRLSFPLLSDQDGRVRALYHVPKAFGVLPGRSTYVIGKDKRIKSVVHSQLGAETHVLESLHALAAGAR